MPERKITRSYLSLENTSSLAITDLKNLYVCLSASLTFFFIVTFHFYSQLFLNVLIVCLLCS